MNFGNHRQMQVQVQQQVAALKQAGAASKQHWSRKSFCGASAVKKKA